MKKIIIVAVILLLLTGCNGSRELEDRSFAMALGIDKDSEQYDTYVSVAEPNIGDDEKSQEKVYSDEGETIEKGIKKINNRIKNKLYFGHTIVCIVDKAILTDSKAIDEILTTVRNSNEFSRNIMLFSTDNVKEIINAKPDDTAISKYINDYMENHGAEKYDIDSAIAAISENRRLAVPTIAMENEAITIILN